MASRPQRNKNPKPVTDEEIRRILMESDTESDDFADDSDEDPHFDPRRHQSSSESEMMTGMKLHHCRSR